MSYGRQALLGSLGVVVLTASLLAALTPGAPEDPRPPVCDEPPEVGDGMVSDPCVWMAESHEAAGPLARRVPVEPAAEAASETRANAEPLLVRGRVLEAHRRKPVLRFRATLTPCSVVTAASAVVPELEPPAHAIVFATSDGCFELPAEHPGWQLLQVWPDCALPVATRFQVTRRNAPHDLRLLVEPGVAGRGIVLDPDGAPVADAWVSLQPATCTDAIGVATSDDGTFRWPAVLPGAYRIRVESPCLPAWESGELLLRLSEREPTWTLRLRRGAAVCGTVRPWHRDRQADVVLTHGSGIARRAAVDPEGRYELTGLTPGPYHVHLDDAGTSVRNYVAEQLRDPAEPPDLTLTEGQRAAFDVRDVAAMLGRVHGRVVGHRAPGTLTVSADREDPPLPDTLAAVLRTSPGPTGAFLFEGLAPGRWRFEVHDAERRLLQRAVQTIGPCAEIAVQLSPGR